jgi:multidrug efflux pump subunit AcrB
MLSRFFLERPVFAWVIAIAIMAAGVFAIVQLPISQYPPIAPPSIAVESFYPGASAKTVENSVTQIIEQKMTGFDKLLYLSATSDASGSSRLELTFAPGTDPDQAWAEVQNKLQLAMASLPEAVQRQGVKVSKSTRNYLMIIGLISEDGRMDGNDLRDFAGSNLEKDLARVPGVGEVSNFGSLYAMRVWLNPDKMAGLKVTIEDVIAAQQESGAWALGVDCDTGEIADMTERGVLDPTGVKLYALRSASEVAEAILRINTIIRKREDSAQAPAQAQYIDPNGE